MAVFGAVLAIALGAVVTQSSAQAARRHVPSEPGAATRVAPSQAAAASPAPTTTVGAASPATTAVAGSRVCGPGDVDITTATDRSSYSPGAQVTVVTKLVSKSSCNLELAPSGQYDCGESLVINTWSSEQVFPAADQKEQCASFPNGPVKPGTADVATIVWNQRTLLPGGGMASVPGGRYQAVGSWSWSAGAGSGPFEVAVNSPPFTIQP